MNPDLSKAQTPEQMAISGANGTPTNQAITPNALTPTKPFTPAITQPYTPPMVAPLPTPNVALTAQEQGALDQVSPYQQLIAQLSGQTSDLAQKSFRQQQAESTGLNTAQNLSQSLYEKQQGLDLRSQAIEAQRQQAIAEKVQSMSGQGIASGIVNRRGAIDTEFNKQALTNTLAKLDNAVSYYAATGKVREATQAVDAAVDAEFTPKLQALATAQANLKTLLDSPDLTSAQQKKALNLQAQYTAQENAIKEAAQIKKDTGDARIKVLTNNPNMSQQAHDAISMAQSPEEVAGLVNYFGLSTLSQQEKFNQDLQTKKFAQDERQFGMNYALQQQKFAEDKRQFGITSSQKEQELNQKANESNLDAPQLIAYAQQYASTGQIPAGIPKGSFGTIAQYAKEAPKAEGTIISKVTGVADSKIPATEQQDFTRLATILKNVERLKALDEKRIGGVYGGTLGKVFGSNAQAEYLATRKAIVDDISRMQSGAALTADEVAFYEDYLPGRFSESFGLGQDSAKKIANFETIMKNRLSDRLDTNNLSIVGFSKVKLDDGNEYTVGQILTNDQGQKGRVNADGSITIL